MSLNSQLVQVFVMYHNNILNTIPILIYPDEDLKADKEILSPIKNHPIWFLDFNEQNTFEHIDIRYKGKVYCARKFEIFSKRSELIPDFNDATTDTVVIIIVLPKILDSYGLNFLSIVSEIILSENIDSFYKIIESEILKKNIIRTPIVKNIINIGDSLKLKIKRILKNIWDNYFQKVINQPQNQYLLNCSANN